MEKRKIAIITGANGGFGREFVKLLAPEDTIDEIWAVARNEKTLEELSVEFGPKIRTYSMDLSDKEEVKGFGAIIDAAHVDIVYLINNAGYGKFCSYENLSVDESINMIDLNVSAVVALGLLCIPHMKKGSHIINIASQAALFPLPYMNIYSATKVFVRNYSRALCVELKNRGISVTAVCPGWMKTDFVNRMNVDGVKRRTHFTGMRMPDKVAKKALQDAKKGKDTSVYGLFSKAMHVFIKIVPHQIPMKMWLRINGLK